MIFDIRMERFQGDTALQFQMAREVDGAHRAAREDAVDSVAAVDRLADERLRAKGSSVFHDRGRSCPKRRGSRDKCRWLAI